MICVDSALGEPAALWIVVTALQRPQPQVQVCDASRWRLRALRLLQRMVKLFPHAHKHSLRYDGYNQESWRSGKDLVKFKSQYIIFVWKLEKYICLFFTISPLWSLFIYSEFLSLPDGHELKLRWHELGASEADDVDEDTWRPHVQFWPQDHWLGRLLHPHSHSRCPQVFVQVKSCFSLLLLHLLAIEKLKAPIVYGKKNTIPFDVPALCTGSLSRWKK